MTKDRIPYELIGKYITSQISEEEANELEKWRTEREGNEKEFQMLLAVWHVPGNTGKFEEEGEQILKEILAKPKTAKLIPLNRFLLVAASITVALILGLMYNFLIDTDHELIQYQATENGELKILPDGTKVWLKSGSALSYYPDFNTERKINFTGEAYFQVYSDPDHPFTISTDDVKTTVLGTSFNLSAPKNIEVMVLHLDEGKVSVQHESNQRILSPGQVISVSKTDKKMEIRTVTNDNHQFLRTGKLFYKEVKLAQVCQELARHYNVEIQLQVDNPDELYTGRFNNKSVAEVLEIIALTLNLDITKTEDTYFLKSQ